MIVVKNTGSRYFEEAQFIIKNNAYDVRECDLVKEASMIVGAVLTENGKESKPKGRVLKGLIAFLISFVSGAALGIVLCLAF